MQCPVVNGQVCAGHGVCGIDQDAGAARCFCNKGAAGASCASAALPDGAGAGASRFSPMTLLTVLAIVLLVTLLVLAVILYQKIKTLRTDDGVYDVLSTETVAQASA